MSSRQAGRAAGLPSCPVTVDTAAAFLNSKLTTIAIRLNGCEKSKIINWRAICASSSNLTNLAVPPLIGLLVPGNMRRSGVTKRSPPRPDFAPVGRGPLFFYPC
jgi:hypothetical protein